ncbi:MAG: hypothetical protein D6730_00160 [Bacteroidetes bacterium]|nr:MAG: hypothetical protein D6730_00160 [Bacteroidota bacterium]
MYRFIFLCFATCCLLACRSFEATPYDFPTQVDTRTRPIEMQQKGVFAPEGAQVYADNQFDGARLNDFSQLEEGHFQATILPENSPINPSPYYAFRLWADQARAIRLRLHYPESKHRYWPKISHDGRTWQRLDSAAVLYPPDSVDLSLLLQVGPDTLWVAAQEVTNSGHVRAWCESMAAHPDVSFFSVGQSVQGRDLFCLDVGHGPARGKEVVAILSRQHPPEVTGYLALQAFLEEVLADHALSRAFRAKYRLLVYPLMNPDGVDLGHWRHNAGGIDLNRDWAYYHQPETRQVANHLVRTSRSDRNQVILGLDFHSTYYDIYYTFDNSMVSSIHGFKDFWLMGIADAIPGYHPHDAPNVIAGPVSKNWFFTQFGAEGITYEIGDDTPRDFIREKGKKSAREMMQLLVLR